MRERPGVRFGRDDLITGGAMLLTWLLVHWLFPELSTRISVLIALLGGFAASAVIYVVKKKKKEKEDAERLPPL